MNVSKRKLPACLAFGVLFLLAGFLPARSQTAPGVGSDAAHGTAVLHWQTPAQWHRGLFRNTSGVLAINDSGVAFEPSRGSRLRWSFEQIQTFSLTSHSLRLIGYQNRRWHFHGEREFRFDLGSPVPPTVAAALANTVGKPSKNGVVDPNAAAVATIAARHQTLGGGTNGILRFREAGIDYVTQSGKGGRSWRWADIETLTMPDPYHLGVGGYREHFSFELKQAMSSRLFDWLWNRVYGRALAGLNPGRGADR